MTTAEGPTIEVEMDGRQRLPLAKLFKGDAAARYRVTRLAGGELLLCPVVSLTERELAVLANPDTMAALKRGIADAEAGRVTAYPAGHFAKALADMDDGEDDD